MKNSNRGRFAASIPGLIALVVVALVSGVGGAVAAGQIGSAQIKDGSVKSVDIRDNGVQMPDLSQYARGRLLAVPNKANLSQVRAVESRVDRIGLVDQENFTGAVANIGGSFVSRSTDLGSINLEEAGTYTINGYAFFDGPSRTKPEGTTLMLALRAPDGSQFGQDVGTCFTGVVPDGDREGTCSVVRTVTVDGPTTINVKAFGYNEDQSSTGSGEYTVFADVSALAVPQVR